MSIAQRLRSKCIIMYNNSFGRDFTTSFNCYMITTGFRTTRVNGTRIIIITIYGSNVARTIFSTVVLSTLVIISTILVRGTLRSCPTSTSRIISRINREVFATFFTMASINCTYITIIARNLNVDTTNIRIARINGTSIVIITTNRSIVTSVI